MTTTPNATTPPPAATLQASPELVQELATTRAQLEKTSGIVAKFLARQQAEAKKEAKTFMASLIAKDPLLFGAAEADAFVAAYEAAKLGELSDNAEVAAFAAAQIGLLEKFAAAKSRVVPSGERKPAPPKSEAVTELTAEDFRDSSPEAQSRIAAAVDEYIRKEKLTGANAYMTAFNHLAAAHGVRSVNAAIGTHGPDLSAVEEIEGDE